MLNFLSKECHFLYKSCSLKAYRLSEAIFLYILKVANIRCFECVNVYVLPRFDLCHVHIFVINKQFRTCANAFSNEFTVRSYEYCAGQHCILYWMQENQIATYFLRSKLFTYDIMKNFNYN
jgi:hypothetical protein